MSTPSSATRIVAAAGGGANRRTGASTVTTVATASSVSVAPQSSSTLSSGREDIDIDAWLKALPKGSNAGENEMNIQSITDQEHKVLYFDLDENTVMSSCHKRDML